MGVSWAVDDDGWSGGTQREVRLTGSFDASYNNGGESLTPDDAGLDAIEDVVVLSPATESGYVVRYDHDSDSVILFEEDGSAGSLAEVTDGSDVSTETVDLQVRGRS